MDVSIIIVSWNVKHFLERCLLSIRHAAERLDIELIVIDNHSGDGSAEMVAERFPGARLIRNQGNFGFARACNQGIAAAAGRYIFILNPDTEVTHHALTRLVRYMDKHQDVALVAPRLVNPDGSFQRGSIRRDPTLASQLLIMLKAHRLRPHMRPLQTYLMSDFDARHEQDVEQVMGAAMFMRRATLNDFGGFDERFYLWFEEVDLCKRLREGGEQIRFYPEATVVHHGGQSFKQRLPLRRQVIFNGSLLRYFYKHKGLVQTAILALAMPLNLLMEFVYQLFTGYVRK